ncbi:MAG: phosphatidylserine decarboxylase [Anaeromicrobium sp.]|jgi:phosphatidylserine decarboxylase|uniref:phosphatidylserine decarboxylase n=1 Tax=Anaeromicrobium sp. TaxID=1929132 RepID=UPI0025E8D336|nr:phosphatidylserine decarboxylase [Anaeromicrobium sp.]MCT4595820.1 phosphatidylserine decarboxylase [Anaeromicrobium sp.]
MSYYIDRKTGKKVKEKVAGNQFIVWTYNTSVGKGLLELIVKRKFFSSLYGKLQDSSHSKKKIGDFVRDFNIHMGEAEREDILEYTSFNDFFTRRLKSESRKIDRSENALISPADGKILAYENIHVDKIIQVKGFFYKLKDLFNDKNEAELYEGGTCIVVRLAPNDYHRFHFVDDGIPRDVKRIKGDYYSVNPIALREVISLYCRNKRHITMFDSKNFGQVAFVDVGATCVGSIIQTFNEYKEVKKGDEKGYFKFGGSTVIMFLQKGMVNMDLDIVGNSKDGIETSVFMGEKIGEK